MDALQAHHRAAPGPQVMGWKLDRAEREALLARFPPAYARAVADHVTLRFGVQRGSPLPDEARGEIVGRADDGSGVEAMVVRIGGTTARPDGGTYHVTWSLANGRTARESNQVIGRHGWAAFDAPVAFALQPAFFR
jgi:hypothetical protein